MRQKGFAPIIILVLVVLVTLGYLGYKSIKPTNQMPNESISSPVPTPTADPTANWKTYTGKIFEFKYPGNLYAIDTSFWSGPESIWIYSDKVVAEKDVECLKRKQGDSAEQCFFTPPIMVSYSSKDENTQIPKIGITRGIEYVEYTNPIGLTMVKNKTILGGMGNDIINEAYVTKGSLVYKIQMITRTANCWPVSCPNISDEESSQKGNDLLDQILSTFKFIE